MVRILTKALIALVGIVILVVLAFAFAPARAITLATDRVEGLVVSATSGRLWRGEAQLAFKGEDLGRLGWSFEPSGLAAGALAVEWRLTHDDYLVAGTAVRGLDDLAFAASGTIDAVVVSRFLARYYISLDGVFDIKGLDVYIDAEGTIAADGELRWTGGRSVYRLSGQSHDTELPPMTGRLVNRDGEPYFEAVSSDDGVRLLTARLDREGWAHIGVTAELASLGGVTWRGGSDGRGDVVVTVSERLFESAPVRPQGAVREPTD